MALEGGSFLSRGVLHKIILLFFLIVTLVLTGISAELSEEIAENDDDDCVEDKNLAHQPEILEGSKVDASSGLEVDDLHVDEY